MLQSKKAKDSLSKFLYETVFEDLVYFINKNLSPQPNSKIKLNMLDIAGFGNFF